MKEIDLENMSGRDFETLCKEIFSKYYKVEVEQTALVGDGGKDLIIRTPVPIYVECKHHRATIGRPVVQKLHSAMITDFVRKGMIVTTGKFSPQAIEHVRSNNLPIELMDGEKLRGIAESVGIKLFFGFDVNIPQYVVIPQPEEAIEKAFWSALKAHVSSGPKTVEDYARITRIDHSFECFYRYRFTHKQDFTNQSKEILIASLNESGYIFLDMNSLALAPAIQSSYLGNASVVPIPESDVELDVEPADHIRVDIENAAYSGIIERYSTEKEYVTTNNRTVTKKIVPTRSHIQLSDLCIVYVRHSVIAGDIQGTLVKASYAYNGKSEKINLSMNISCPDCHRVVDKVIVCDDCKKMYCTNSARTCSLCKKLICMSCTLNYKTGFFSKAPICRDCAKAHPELKIKK